MEKMRLDFSKNPDGLVPAIIQDLAHKQSCIPHEHLEFCPVGIHIKCNFRFGHIDTVVNDHRLIYELYEAKQQSTTSIGAAAQNGCG